MSEPSPRTPASADAALTKQQQQDGFLKRALEELGLVSMYASPRDVKLLCAQRFVRMFAYGVSTLILVAYLDALAVPKPRIGLFMTLTLIGDTCASFFLTLFADAVGRRAVLALGAALMSASGVVFALFDSYWVLLAAAVVGVISPNGNEIGPFRAIEESIVAHLTDPRSRSDIYAWYSLLGLVGAACGTLTCGWVVEHLNQTLQWDDIRSYRAIYFGYGVLGLVKLTLTVLLSHTVESEKKKKQQQQQEVVTESDETRPLLGGVAETNPPSPPPPPPPKRGLRTLFPDISPESVPVVITLCLLFALDSFGSGLAPLSWITYYFKSQFNIDEGKLGTIFFATQTISGISMIAASSLAKRFGNVNTMVFTHLPSQIFRSLIGVPSSAGLALAFLALNAATQSMDTAPRSAFLAAVVRPEERTAVMGTVNVVKTAAASLGPLPTGLLAARGRYGLAFAASGGLKILYDLGLLAFFGKREWEQHRKERNEGESVLEAPRPRGGEHEHDDEVGV
ncbi:hypothetical protein AAE478_007573 [Parahypoxylon ruwenzoriense]